MALPRTFEELRQYLRAAQDGLAWPADARPDCVVLGVDPALPGSDRTAVTWRGEPITDAEGERRRATYALTAEMVREGIAARYGIMATTDEARARARSLLLRFLTPAQREQYGKDNSFEHVGEYGTYRLRLGRSYNVQFAPKPGAATPLKGERAPNVPAAGAILCAIPAGAGEMPVEDILIAQLLWLRRNEDDFWGRANIGPVDMPVWYVTAPQGVWWSRPDNGDWLYGAAADFGVIDDPQAPHR